MKQPTLLYQSVGYAITTLAGTLLHFLYDRTGGSLLATPFSGINESTWEHMKLLFWPLFLYALLQRPHFRNREDFWTIKLSQILLGLTLIPVLFYTYNGAIGPSPDWLNIAIFYLSAAAAFLLEWCLFQKASRPAKHPTLPLAALLLIAALFIVFTFRPPHIPLFQDPLTGTYGLSLS